MLLPASPMELSISYIFGFWRGFTIVYFGKLCTCLLAYILSRSCLRSWAHEAFSKHEVLRAFEGECVSRPWRVAFRGAFLAQWLLACGDEREAGAGAG